MKKQSRILARSVIEICKDLPAEKHGEVIDAALAYLHAHHLSREVKMFPRILKAALEESTGTLSARMHSSSGKVEEKERAALLSALESSLKRKVDLTEHADQSLLGGALLEVGDERFDASLSGALREYAALLHAPLSLSSPPFFP